ncbi:MAG TPA: hypothetical protein VFR40_01630 [Lapillicoccus sp.]|nr:hypothetical protein [Lapillicoccus sp.]
MTHTHTHPHHAVSPERAANLAENPYAGQGSVLLDIGDDIGALVLHVDRQWEGAEVSYRRAHEPYEPHAHQPHVAVVGRPTEGGPAYTAVFPELVAGRYVLALPDGTELVADVDGGRVTEIRRPG